MTRLNEPAKQPPRLWTDRVLGGRELAIRVRRSQLSLALAKEQRELEFQNGDPNMIDSDTLHPEVEPTLLGMQTLDRAELTMVEGGFLGLLEESLDRKVVIVF